MPLTSRRSKTWYWNVPVRWVTFGEQSRVISRERRSLTGEWRSCGAYSGAGIGATMPGSGLFRVKEVCVGERPVNAEEERVLSWNCPA